MKSISQTIGASASEIGKGMVAGDAGTAAITLSQMVEMKITKRGESTMPADAASKVLDVKPSKPEKKKKLSNEVHWAYGTSWGLMRGLLSLFRIRSVPAAALHFATIYTATLLMPPALKVAPPLKKWGAKSIAIDALHHAVYVLVAGLVYDRISHSNHNP